LYNILKIVLEVQFCEISSRSDLKWRSLRLFWRGIAPREEQEEEVTAE